MNSSFKTFFDKNIKLCLYLIFPSPLLLFFAWSVFQSGQKKEIEAKSTVNTDIKVLQGDSTIDDPFAYFDEQEANKNNKIDYSGGIDLNKLKEENKEDYERILAEEKALADEQKRANNYSPPVRKDRYDYQAEDVINRRKNYDVYERDREEVKESKKMEEEVKESNPFNTASTSSNVRSSTSSISVNSKPVKIMAIASNTYKNGNSIKFKLIDKYNEFEKGTTIVGVFRMDDKTARVVFNGSQLGEQGNLELYTLNMERGLEIEQRNRDVEEAKQDIRQEGGSLAGDIVRSVPIVGGTAERLINRQGNRRRDFSAVEVEVLSGQKFYITK